MVLVPPYPPLQDSPVFLALQCISPIFSLLSSYCLLSVRFCVVDCPPQKRLVTRPSVGSLQPSSWLLTKCPPDVLSSVPYEGLRPPPRPVRMVVLGLGVGGGAKETAPPAMILRSSMCCCHTTRRLVRTQDRSIFDALDSPRWSLYPSLCLPPPPPPHFPVQPHMSQYPPS